MDASGQINQHIFREGGGVCPKTSILVIPKAGLSARNLLSLKAALQIPRAKLPRFGMTNPLISNFTLRTAKQKSAI